MTVCCFQKIQTFPTIFYIERIPKKWVLDVDITELNSVEFMALNTRDNPTFYLVEVDF